jgi:hypothetical protein
MRQTLNELFSSFSSGELNRDDFESSVYNFLFFNQEKTCLNHWERETYEDFISCFYPRLKMAIDSYQDTGSSFEAYMSKYFLVSSKEYHVRSTINKSPNIQYGVQKFRRCTFMKNLLFML